MPGSISRQTHYDVAVVGARCAGAATAMLLARSGLSVVALERTPHGSDTVSTHALMRAGVLQLHRWGILPGVIAAGTPAIRTTSFSYGDETIEVTIKPRDGVPALFAPRRTVIDPLLQDAAVAAGVELIHGARVVDLVRDESGRVHGVLVESRDGQRAPITADLVVGADGVNSAVARAVGAAVDVSEPHASGVVYGYLPGLELDGYRWYWQPGVSIGLIPTNGGNTCVFASTSAARFRAEVRADIAAGFRRILAEGAPEVAAEVAARPLDGKLMAFAGVAGFLRRSWGPGWALVGDAGYFKDPITAHGITDALRDAELLARAVLDGTPDALASYQTQRDELSHELLAMSSRIATYDWTLDELKQIHVELSKAMNREVEALLSIDREAASSGPAAVALTA